MDGFEEAKQQEFDRMQAELKAWAEATGCDSPGRAGELVRAMQSRLEELVSQARTVTREKEQAERERDEASSLVRDAHASLGFDAHSPAAGIEALREDLDAARAAHERQPQRVDDAEREADVLCAARDNEKAARERAEAVVNAARAAMSQDESGHVPDFGPVGDALAAYDALGTKAVAAEERDASLLKRFADAVRGQRDDRKHGVDPDIGRAVRVLEDYEGVNP